MLPGWFELWNFGRPAESEERFRELLSAHPEASVDWTCQVQTQVARSLGLQRKFEDAHQLLDGVREHWSELSARTRAYYFLERGRAFNSGKQPADAEVAFVEAFGLAKAEGIDDLAVDAAHMLGIVELGERSMEWNRTALRLAEGSDDPRARRWVASLCNNLGWTYHDAGEFERALELFQRALREREAEGTAEQVHIAQWAVGRCLRSMGRFEEALAIMRVLAGAPDDGYVQEEQGENLLAMGRTEEARPHFARAYELLRDDPWGDVGEERLQRLQRLGAG